MKRLYAALIWVHALGVAFPLAMRGGDAPIVAWRTPANGGINCVYCYLQVNGVKCDYPALVESQRKEVGSGTHTVATLARIAGEYGVPLKPYSLTMAELASCALPVIVHIDGESPDAGAFLLLTSFSAYTVQYIDGPTATIQEITQETFRRIWSGVALLPETNRWKRVAFCLAGLSAGLLIFASLPVNKLRIVTCK